MKPIASPRGVSVLWPAAAIAGVVVALWATGFLVRTEQALPAGASSQFVWQLQPAIVLPILLLAALYILGARQPAALGNERRKGRRHLAFLGGLAAVFIALESPLDFLSDHLFVAHMFEHMQLEMVAPMLIVLARPEATLMRGLPHPLRRYVLNPFLGSRVFRGLRFFAHPAVATALFIGALYFWMIPYFHDLALRDEGFHELWHATLLAAGLILFWRVLDPRPYPQGASLGARLFMFFLASIANILLGSFLAFKSAIVYPGYGPSPHLFGINAADDEHFGGLTMWIPGSMMLALAALLTIRHFAREEERREGRRQAARERGGEWLLERRSANRRMALGLLSFAAVVLAITVGTVLLYHYAQRGPLLNAL
jgi:putative membrane protein